MTQTSEKNGQSSSPTRRLASKKANSSTKIFNLIMEYRESRLFQWIKLHPEISIGIVALWGMLIIIFFLWFIFSMAPA
jgi:hypothetical protein